jgi:hypothetical protein
LYRYNTAAQLEITVLKKLMGADPENKRHCVRFLRSFEFRDHVFMCFESMHMNLREVLKKYGRNVGINVHGVRSFGGAVQVCVLFYYKIVLLPDAAWKQNELVLLNKRLCTS